MASKDRIVSHERGVHHQPVISHPFRLEVAEQQAHLKDLDHYLVIMAEVLNILLLLHRDTYKVEPVSNCWRYLVSRIPTKKVDLFATVLSTDEPKTVVAPLTRPLPSPSPQGDDFRDRVAVPQPN